MFSLTILHMFHFSQFDSLFVTFEFLQFSVEILLMSWIVVLIILQAYNKISNLRAIKISLLVQILSILLTFLLINYKQSLFLEFYANNFYSIVSRILLFFIFIAIFSQLWFNTSPKASVQILMINCLSLLLLLFITSSNLFLTYIALEGINFLICGFMIIGKPGQKKVEAVVKYFLISAVTTGILVYGISEIYRVCNTLEYSGLNFFFHGFALANNQILIFAILAVVVGFVVKINVAPFYLWSIEVYGNISYLTLFLIMVPVKFSLLIGFIKIMVQAFSNIFSIWNQVLLVIALISIFLGSLGALFQDEIKKFIVFASINQSGFILLALSCGTFNGVFSALYHLIVYTFSSVALFSFIMNHCTSDKNTFMLYLSQLKNITNTFAKLFISLVFLSLAGIPPFLGFFTKLSIFYDVTQFYGPYMVLLLLALNIMSGIYYIGVVRDLLFINDFKFVYQPVARSLVVIALLLWFIPQIGAETLTNVLISMASYLYAPTYLLIV